MRARKILNCRALLATPLRVRLQSTGRFELGNAAMRGRPSGRRMEQCLELVERREALIADLGDDRLGRQIDQAAAQARIGNDLAHIGIDRGIAWTECRGIGSAGFLLPLIAVNRPDLRPLPASP